MILLLLQLLPLLLDLERTMTMDVIRAAVHCACMCWCKNALKEYAAPVCAQLDLTEGTSDLLCMFFSFVDLLLVIRMRVCYL